MKTTSTFLLLLVFVWTGITPSLGQTNSPDTKNNVIEEPNLVKVNLLAIPLSNFSFQYERALTNKISGALGVRIMPKSNLPFKSSFKSLIDDDEAWRYLDELKISNFAITPEVRFYLGKSVFRGFYVAPFVRYANYTLDMPFEFEYETFSPDVGNGNMTNFQESTIPLNGSISSFTGGAMLGAQWKLGKMIYLDWWILGPHYGSATGNIKGTKNLSPMEQEGLRDNLEELKDLPFVESYEVDASGASLRVKGPWGGIRAGLSLGIRF